jgi:hypothetical protein
MVETPYGSQSYGTKSIFQDSQVERHQIFLKLLKRFVIRSEIALLTKHGDRFVRSSTTENLPVLF